VRKSIFLKRPKNDSNVKDDPYETTIFAYNREMNQLVEANTNNSKVKEEDFMTCMDGGMTKSNEEEESMMP
jgi:hypothetical protein